MLTNASIGKKYCMRSQLAIRKYSLTLFKGYGLCLVLSILAAIYFASPLPLLLPVALIFVFQLLVDFEKIYFLLFMSLPLSTEVFITDHLATDLPTEPLIVGLMILYFLLLLVDPTKLNVRFLRHPFSKLLLAHLAWTALTTFSSSSVGFSFKFFLAKFWYIVTFLRAICSKRKGKPINCSGFWPFR